MPNYLDQLYASYAQNTARFPVLYSVLAGQLGVSSESTAKAEVGFIPIDEHGNQAWAFPERNAKGDVVGIHERLDNGKKYAVKGSKRGLAYMVNHDITQYEGDYGWERTSAGQPCPICHGASSDGSFKPSGCLYPKGEYDNPNAVICVRTSVGAVKELGLGHLHIVDPARQKLVIQDHSLLLPSERPILVVEGWSDVLAAYNIGFVAIGKPSGCSKQTGQDLAKLLCGRDVVVMGENDKTGIGGMEATATLLLARCASVTKLMPPKTVSDLRQWTKVGLTQEGLLAVIEASGQQLSKNKLLKDDRAITVANAWIDDYLTCDGVPTFGRYKGSYVGYDGVGWETMVDDKVYARLIGDMGYKNFTDASGNTKPYKLTNAKISDVLRACTVNCLIEKTDPCWLDGRDRPDPNRLILLTNGILDIDRYMAGDTANMMRNHDPNLFTFYKLPYAFDEDAESQVWDDFCLDTFQKKDKMLLASEWGGYQFMPDMRQEVMMVCQGVKRGGKGTYGNTLQHMLGGSPNASVTTFPTLAGQFGLAPLQNALSVIVGDATSDSKGGSEQAILLTILNIVGRDAAILNPKHKAHLDMVTLRCRFTFCMNFFPKFRDDSGALMDRTMILTFTNSHSGREDKTLKDRLAKEASEGKMLNWALRGLKSLYTRGSFTIPEESVGSKKIFASVSSPFGQFREDCYETDSNGPGVHASRIWYLWKWWCKDAGVKYGGKSDFIHKLVQMTPNTREVPRGVDGNTERMIAGIKLTELATEAIGNC